MPMRIEFAYGQARAQAQHGARLGSSDWRVLESSRTPTQFLHAARATALAPHLVHLTADTPPHAIDRSLRRDWRGVVAAAGSWSPPSWRLAIEWTARLPDLPARAYLAGGGASFDWMREDTALAGDASPASAPGDDEQADAGHAVLANWLLEWRRRWPSVTAAEAAALEDLVRLAGEHRDIRLNTDLDIERLDGLVSRLQAHCTRLLRRHRQQPAAVFCHLALAGIDLWRLRAGLMRRAMLDGAGGLPA
jgi:hypothetical protein